MQFKKIITYGTFDLLHYGHIYLLKRAKALGDYLIVGLSSDEFNQRYKHKQAYFSYDHRKILLESIRYVDMVIPEISWEQKALDIKEFSIDTIVMGDDWQGRFDDLRQYANVIYLPRTPEISSTSIKNNLMGGGDCKRLVSALFITFYTILIYIARFTSYSKIFNSTVFHRFKVAI